MEVLTGVLIALMYVAGFAFRVLVIADKDVKQTLFTSKRAWFTVFWPNTLVRCGLMLCIWMVYATSPNVVVGLLSHFGLNFNMALPVTKITSFMGGYVGDALLDIIGKRIPFIGRIIPEPYIPHEVKAQAALKDTTNDPVPNNPHDV